LNSKNQAFGVIGLILSVREIFVREIIVNLPRPLTILLHISTALILKIELKTLAVR